MSHERLSSRQEIAIKELSEIDFALASPMELYQALRQLALEGGIDPSEALYVGLDTYYDDPLRDGFDDRTTTWAFTDAEYQETVESDHKVGVHSKDSPIHYAEDASLPTVLIFDGTQFDNALGQKRVFYGEEYDWDDDICGDSEYRVKPGVSFGDTLVAALRVV